MNILSNLSHQLINRYYRKKYLAFKQDMPDFKNFQLNQLRKLLIQSEQTSWGKISKVSSEWSYKKFSENLEPSSYENYHRDVENQMVSKYALCPFAIHFVHAFKSVCIYILQMLLNGSCFIHKLN